MAGASSSTGNTLEPIFSYIHHDLNHSVSSFSAMNEMRDNNQFCDISLRIGENVTKAHRLVLASSSPYFYAMFNIDMAEKSQSEIKLFDIDLDALQMLVKFMYTSRIVITKNSVQKLLSASSLLQIDSVRDACVAFFIKQLSPTNCLGTRQIAETYSLDALSDQAFIYALKNFEMVANCEEFLDLSFSEVEKLVSEDKLYVLSEENVYLAVIRWIKYNQAERFQYIRQLIGHVRLGQLSKNFLTDVVCKEPLVYSDSSCNEIWSDVMKYQDYPILTPYLSSKRAQRRLGGMCVFAIGGVSDMKTFYDSGERYDFINDCWLPIPPMSNCRGFAGIASLGGRIYATGGFDGRYNLSSAECYDPIFNKWSPIKSLDTSRIGHGISAMDGLLYVCGGSKPFPDQSSVVRYDPLVDVWLSCPSMSTSRHDCRVSVIDNCLYVVGGCTGETNYLSTVERYDPRMRNWMAVPKMSTPRAYHAVSTLYNTLYCVGGMKDANTLLLSGERFNIRRNAWEPICNMLCSRAYPNMVAMNGRLMLLGGVKDIQNSTEWYDPRKNLWTIATPMLMPRFGLGTALLYCCDMDSKLKSISEYTQLL